MEKNFSKGQTPPRSTGSPLDNLIANNRTNSNNNPEFGSSPPGVKFLTSNSSSKSNNLDEIMEKRHKQNEFPIVSSPRLNYLSQNEFRIISENQNTGMELVRNNFTQKLTRESSAGVNPVPIFIDDLEEETILDVNIQYLKKHSIKILKIKYLFRQLIMKMLKS